MIRARIGRHLRRRLAGGRQQAKTEYREGQMNRFVLLLALAACAREVRSINPDNWLELQSEHFVLRTDLSQDDARKAVGDLELVRNALLAAGWSSPHPSPDKILVVALAGGRALREFLPERLEGMSLYGLFGERLVLVDGEGDLADSELVKHEVTHALAYDLLVANPRWVQEGLACYLETLEIDRSKGRRLAPPRPPSFPSAGRNRVANAHPRAGLCSFDDERVCVRNPLVAVGSLAN